MAILAAIRAKFDELIPFTAEFMRRCVESTVFSGLCMRTLDSAASATDWTSETNPYRGWGIENEVVCTYVDRVAARRGIPLADRDDATVR